jgi:predicted membrane protein DUF2306
VTNNPAGRPGRSTTTTRPPATAARPAPSRSRGTLWLLVVTAAIVATLVYIMPPYLTFDPKTARNFFLPGFSAHYVLIMVHVFTGAIAWLSGLLQIWPWLLRNHPKAHRISGLIYVFAGALPTTVMAIVLRAVADYRDHTVQPGAIGLHLAAALWFATTVIGYRRARQRRFAGHRRWMTYSFALALTTLWNRPVALLTIAYFPASLSVALEVIGWMPLILHLGVAHWWVTRRKSPVLETVLARENAPVAVSRVA